MIKDILNTFKKPLIVLGVIVVVFIALRVILPVVNNATINNSPIVEILSMILVASCMIIDVPSISEPLS